MASGTISCFMDLFPVDRMTKFEKEWASGLTTADIGTVAQIKTTLTPSRYLFDPVRKKPVLISFNASIISREMYMTVRTDRLPEDTPSIGEVILSETGLLWVRTEAGKLILPPGLGTMRPILWDLEGRFHVQCVAVVNSLLQNPSAPVPLFQEAPTLPLPAGLMEFLRPEGKGSRVIPRKKLLKAAGFSK